MLSLLLGLMASSVIGFASAEDLQPCANAFYVPSQVRYRWSLHLESNSNVGETIVYLLRWLQALPHCEWPGDAALRGGLLPRIHVLVRSPFLN